jgi:hypothetical protein
MTPYLLKVHPQTFLFIPVTQKFQILGCGTLVVNERYAYDLRPSGESVINYVALLWVEVGQPWTGV